MRRKLIEFFSMWITLHLIFSLFLIKGTESITAFGLEGGLSREQPPSRPEQIWDNPLMRPAFDTIEIDVLASAGRVAYLLCRVNHIGNRVVTWIRNRDAHVLTVGLFSYTTDQRFKAIHREGSEDWLLKVTSAQIRDSGIYECQVPTEPKISKGFNLTVIESSAIIEGSRNVHMSKGDTLNLTCFISVPGERPAYFYWYHNDEVVKFKRFQDKNEINIEDMRSNLVIAHVRSKNNGNYTCAPENAKPTVVTVYVVDGEHPAAMQHGESSTAAQKSLVLLLLSICRTIIYITR